MLIIQSSIGLILFIGILTYLFIFSKGRNKHTTLDLPDKLIMLGFSVVYALLSFIHFADTNQYDHPWHGINFGDQITLNLTTKMPLSAFYYSTGFIKGKYRISATSDTNQAIMLDDKSAKLGYPPYFRWNKISFDGKTKVARIVIHVDQGPVDITKVAVVDKNGHIFANYKIISNTNQNLPLNNLISTKLPQHIDDNWQSSTVFDEIYYATSAYQYLHNMSPDVWVHPQLGIYFILIGIIIFGMSPLGWRIMPDISSILLVPLIYIFAKRVFKSRKMAIIASVLILCEFMHYTIGRTASIDPFVTLFLTLEYYFLYVYVENRMHGVEYRISSRNLLYTAIMFGLAISAKWSALYSAPVILFFLIYCELIHNRPNMRQLFIIVVNSILLFIVLPLLIYLLIYIPFAMINHNDDLITRVYQIQLGILDFNLHGLTHATHPYASHWWSWPLDVMPLAVYYWQDAKNYMSSSIALLGNPALYWFTWPTMGFLAYEWFKKSKNYIAAFLLLTITAQYLPYAFIARISFIYYFYSVTPFLVLGVCYLLRPFVYSNKKIYSSIVYYYLAINLILFMLFFTALSGIQVPRSYTAHALLWFPGWNF